MLLLAPAPADACSDPLDQMQGFGAWLTCVFHLSVLPYFIEWINDVNCLAVMISWMDLMELEGCQPLVGYPSSC